MIVARERISVYEPRGEYQQIVDSLEPKEASGRFNWRSSNSRSGWRGRIVRRGAKASPASLPTHGGRE